MMKKQKLDAVVGLMTVGACLIVLSLGSWVMAGNTGVIKGVVLDDSTGKPLPSAAVQVVGTTLGDLTDPNGEFMILNVPPGVYSVQIRHVGFKTKEIDSLEITWNDTIEIEVRLGRVALESEIIKRVTSERDLMEAGKPTSNSLLSGTIKTQGSEKLHIRGGRSAPQPFTVGGCINDESGYPPAHGGTTPPNGEPVDAMFFENYGVNPFVSTEDDRLSTFAVDVDDASYVMTRAYLHNGILPPKDAVRVEEFVNHFAYGYDPPRHDAFELYVDGSKSPFGANYKLLGFGIKGRVISPENRRPAVLTFVIDVSGSMGREDRLGLVKRALRMLVDQLRPDDLVGIAVYGSRGSVVLEHTSVSNKERIIGAIEQLVSGGSTFAEEGITIGYQMAERSFREGAINRIILCSDGVANVGQTGADDILKRIEKSVKRGITLSSIGFGMANYNDVLLEKLGNRGNGYYAYVDNIEDARKIFVDNLTGALEVVAKDVKIQVEFDPLKVDRYRLLGFENRDVKDEDFRDDTVDGGEIGSGHSCTALYEVRLKDGARGPVGSIAIRFKDPVTDEVTEISRKIDVSVIDGQFSAQTPQFRLAAVAAEFAEILRESYWARGSEVSNLLNYALSISNGLQGDADVIELIDLISKASALEKQHSKR